MLILQEIRTETQAAPIELICISCVSYQKERGVDEVTAVDINPKWTVGKKTPFILGISANMLKLRRCRKICAEESRNTVDRCPNSFLPKDLVRRIQRMHHREIDGLLASFTTCFQRSAAKSLNFPYWRPKKYTSCRRRDASPISGEDH
jgi:hypothetical protein